MNKTPRLLSLDVFRGITVALMILVNSPGNPSTYAWLEHSAWNGCTLADLVFPFFLFIVGVSITFTLKKAQERGFTLKQLVPKILKRTLILLLIGLLLNAFPYHFDIGTIRVFGVLQRIAVCYFIVALLFLTTRIWTQAIIMWLFMLSYWLIMVYIPSYDLTPEGNFAAYIDRLILAPAHLYGKVFDPEGLLSTLPAVATTLLGSLTGAWLLTTYGHKQKLIGMATAGFLALLAGWLWGFSFPINKALWSSSYVLWTGGFALLTLAISYWFIEVKSWKKWAIPFELFGMNAMLAYVLHVFFLKAQAMILIQHVDGSTSNLRQFLSDYLFHWFSLPNASLLYACSYTLLWLVIIRLYNLPTKNRSNNGKSRPLPNYQA